MIDSRKMTAYWGWMLIGIGSVSFVGFLFVAVISKLLPFSNNPIISAVQNDSQEENWGKWLLSGLGISRVLMLFSITANCCG
ncbi:hypothetical protein JCGZ_25950 [Jatropha curcas]|uniref:Uncharacterized protein n=1 Tax=Jatropha curcas TaxID=180498 RepID=A0A067JRG6_JATCU|nr:hypothetical protein JCGZ_25950 [Jatropha curcas]